MKNINQNKKGIALITVVMFFLVMVILLSGLLFATVNNFGNTQTAQKHTSVFYAAESGLNVYSSFIKDKIDEAISEDWDLDDFEEELISLSGNHLESNFKDNLGNEVTSNIFITEPADKEGMEGYRFIRITSTGSIDGVFREVASEFIYRVESGTLETKFVEFPAAIIAQGSISQDPGNKKTPIQGPLASNKGPFDLGTCPIDPLTGNKSIISYPNTLPTPSYGDCKNPVVNKLDQTIIFNEVVKFDANLGYSSFNTPKQNSGGLLDLKCESGCLTSKKQFVISSWPNNENLTINLYGSSQSDLTILKVTNSPSSITNKITFNGLGRLIVFFDLKSNFTLNNGVQNLRSDNTGIDSSKLSIILRDVSPKIKYSISVSSAFYGSLLTDADVYFPNWNNKKFYGYLVSNTSGIVNLQANSNIGTKQQPVYIYMPKADFQLSSGITVYGTIVANTFVSQSAKTTVIYTKMKDDYPFTLWAPLPYATTETSGEVGDTSIEFIFTPVKEN